MEKERGTIVDTMYLIHSLLKPHKFFVLNGRDMGSFVHRLLAPQGPPETT